MFSSAALNIRRWDGDAILPTEELFAFALGKRKRELAKKVPTKLALLVQQGRILLSGKETKGRKKLYNYARSKVAKVGAGDVRLYE